MSCPQNLPFIQEDGQGWKCVVSGNTSSELGGFEAASRGRLLGRCKGVIHPIDCKRDKVLGFEKLALAQAHRTDPHRIR